MPAAALERSARAHVAGRTGAVGSAVVRRAAPAGRPPLPVATRERLALGARAGKIAATCGWRLERRTASDRRDR